MYRNIVNQSYGKLQFHRLSCPNSLNPNSHFNCRLTKYILYFFFFVTNAFHSLIIEMLMKEKILNSFDVHFVLADPIIRVNYFGYAIIRVNSIESVIRKRT